MTELSEIVSEGHQRLVVDKADFEEATEVFEMLDQAIAEAGEAKAICQQALSDLQKDRDRLKGIVAAALAEYKPL